MAENLSSGGLIKARVDYKRCCYGFSKVSGDSGIPEQQKPGKSFSHQRHGRCKLKEKMAAKASCWLLNIEQGPLHNL